MTMYHVYVYVVSTVVCEIPGGIEYQFVESMLECRERSIDLVIPSEARFPLGIPLN